MPVRGYQGAKGVALARIDTGTTLLDVYCSHIHARYVPEDMDDEYVAHRTLQLYELAKFVTATRSRLPGAAAVLVGDLNTWHGNLGLEMLQCVTGMHDAYAAMHPDTFLQAATHNVPDNKSVASRPAGGGGRGCCVWLPVTDVRLVACRYRETDRPPRQIDHVLFIDASKGEQGHNCFSRHTPAAPVAGSVTHWRVTGAEIVHRKLADGVTPLSDHCGVSVTLTRCDHRDATVPPNRPRVVSTASDLRADLRARLQLAAPVHCTSASTGCAGPAALAGATDTPAQRAGLRPPCDVLCVTWTWAFALCGLDAGGTLRGASCGWPCLSQLLLWTCRRWRHARGSPLGWCGCWGGPSCWRRL